MQPFTVLTETSVKVTPVTCVCVCVCGPLLTVKCPNFMKGSTDIALSDRTSASFYLIPQCTVRLLLLYYYS